MFGLVHLTTWGRRVLPAACVLAALLVAGRLTISRASSAPRAPLPAPKSLPALPPPAPPGPSHVALEPLDVRPTPNPLRGLSPAELNRAALTKPASLGSVCVGRPNRGQLWNAVELTSGPGLRVMVQPETSYGTSSTVATLHAAVADFRASYPDAPDLNVGDLSHARGGYLRPHHSHQLGLDADLGYFYRANGKWYAKANAENLDRELTWAFLKALIAQGAIEYIFMDRSVQTLIWGYALEHGEDPAWLNTLFESPAHRDTLIRHAYGHITHFHVRFLDPAAERTGRLLEARLAPQRRIARRP
jgi:penicillin-insensitive murein endopeptidase